MENDSLSFPFLLSPSASEKDNEEKHIRRFFPLFSSFVQSKEKKNSESSSSFVPSFLYFLFLSICIWNKKVSGIGLKVITFPFFSQYYQGRKLGKSSSIFTFLFFFTFPGGFYFPPPSYYFLPYLYSLFLLSVSKQFLDVLYYFIGLPSHFY